MHQIAKGGTIWYDFHYIILMKKVPENEQSARFDLVYAKLPMAFGDIPEPELAKFVASSNVRGKALDLGCGDGRHALFMAKNGYEVTGVDISNVAIKKLEGIAKSEKLCSSLKLHHSDARNFEYPAEKFDLVAAVTLFDHVTETDVQPLLVKVTGCLKSGGVIFVKVHTVKDPGKVNGSKKVSELSWAIQHYFESNELKNLLSKDFEIIKYSEYDDLDKSHGRPHFHNFAMALARKVDRSKSVKFS